MSESSDILNRMLKEQYELEEAVKNNANLMAVMLVKNLRSVYPFQLGRLKKELAKYNSQTGVWK